MLGKLIKHDFKATGKVMLPLNLILIVVTALGCLLMASRLLQRAELLPLTFLLLFAYVMMIIALGTVTSIYLIVHFYRTMFTAQGYLSFTLPVSPWSLLHSKLIVGFVWTVVEITLSILSALLLVGAASGFRFSLSDLAQVFSSTVSLNGETAVISTSLAEILGYSPAMLLTLLILLMLVSCFYSVATGYGSAALGQLYAKHKVVGTVLALAGTYLLTQIIIGGIMISIALKLVVKISSDSSAVLLAEDMAGIMRSIYQPLFPAMILAYLVLGIAGYVAAGIIMKRKVNLD